MTINIIIGKKSFVTKAILNSIKKAEVFSANDFNNVIIKKIRKYLVKKCKFWIWAW